MRSDPGGDAFREVVTAVTRAVVPVGTTRDRCRRVCKRLAASDLYAGAWVGRADGDPAVSVAAAGDTPQMPGDPAGPDARSRQHAAARALHAADIRTHRSSRDCPDGRDSRATAVVPLDSGDGAVGVLHLSTDRPGAFCPDERAVLADLAGTIAVALRDAEPATRHEDAAADGGAPAVEPRVEVAKRAADVGVWTWDIRANVVTADTHLADIYDMDSEAVVAGVPMEVFYEPIHDDDVDETYTRVLRALHETGELETEYRVDVSDGDPRWVLARGEVAYEDGEPVRMDGAITDITDRKRAEQRLQDREERYRTLFESIDEGFCVVEMLFDEDGEPVDYRFLETNPAFEEQTGLVDVEGARMRDLEPDHEDHWFERYGRIATTGESERFTQRAEQLGDRWFDVFAFRIGEPEERQVAILFDDISERKISERRLAESEQRYRALAENFPNGGVGVYDRDLRYTLVSGTMWADIEVDAADLEGERIHDALPPQTVADVEPIFRGALDGETDSVVSTLGGRTYRVWATPLRDADDEIIAGQSFALDITDRLERERELAESRELLAGQKRVLQLLATGASLTEVLNALVDVIEEYSDGVRGAVLVRHPDGERDATVSAPTLPDAYAEALREASNAAPPLGPCGAATVDGETVVCADVGADEQWDPEWRDRLQSWDLASCHATPIVGSDERVLGSVTVYGSDTGDPLPDQDVLDALADLAGVAVERTWARSALAEREEQFRALITASSDVIYRMSPDWSEMYELEGKDFLADTQEATDDWMEKYIHPEDRQRVSEAIDEAIRTASVFELEHQVEQADGSLGWTFSRAVPMVDDDGEIEEWIGMARDVTERKQFEQALSGLHEASRDLVQAETGEVVARRTVAAATDVLGLDGVGIYLFDDDGNVLRPAASTQYIEDIFGDLPILGPGEPSITWEAFITGDTIVQDDVLESEEAHRHDTPLRSGTWIPLGDHGVLAIVSEEVGGISDRSRRLADHLAATAEATLDRVEREAALRDQERAVERQNRRLEDLNRVNDIIREIDRVLVQATTRDEIERAVCDRLTGDDRFAFAWIGTQDNDGLAPRTWAGQDRGYLDAVALDAASDSSEPSCLTAATGEETLVANVAENLRDDPWREDALSRDLQSVVSVPLRHGDLQYGVLTVYDDEPGAFDRLSRTVISELGDIIANAVNAVETRRALLTDSVVELELAIRDAADPLVQLATEADCELAVRGVVPQSGDRDRVFVTASDAAGDDVRMAAEAAAHVESVSRLDDDGDADERRFELTVSGGAIPSTLVECGAAARSIRITPAETRVEAELPHSTDVRTFVDRLETAYPDTELLARRDRNRGDDSGRAVEAALTADLTDRQLEALQTAYLSGYFEWPRDRTGEEVAESLGITQSTFNGHLRAAERKLCAQLFDGSTQSPR